MTSNVNFTNFLLNLLLQSFCFFFVFFPAGPAVLFVSRPGSPIAAHSALARRLRSADQSETTDRKESFKSSNNEIPCNTELCIIVATFLAKVRLVILSYSISHGNNIDERRLDHQWILHPSGEQIYRPRPSASVCKLFPPWDVKSIDDLASIRQ